MKHLHFDSIGGASGDMILAALIDLGLSVDNLRQGLVSLDLGSFEIEAVACESRHLRGTRVFVRLPEHGHGEHHHHHRTFKDIRETIQLSALPLPVQEKALAVFQCLAEAEGRIHGIAADEVHFHEVGAVDSIVDMVGACLALNRLEVGSVSVGPLPLGHGIIQCAHGAYPSPAPATLEVLAGMVVESVDEPFELVTPTGAALLKTWKTSERPPAGSRMVRTGYGFGHRELQGRPNLLRATLFAAPDAAPATDTCLVLECNIDDTTPELLGVLTQQLMAAGALDVFTTAIQMKKQRPGILLTVLSPADQKNALLDLIFRESTTFGVREYVAHRTILDRTMTEVSTPYGPIHVKIGHWQGEPVTRAPEMDDCILRAKEKNVSVRAVYEAACEAARRKPDAS
ncbi:MAG TPA: nickel pincer cofactor biosynthesis protein LarC [Verrucomicrobia bacterium]|nr:nickel pincer cofactor biosynthesis protein LarC [Verrucomicrobiota bacterium]